MQTLRLANETQTIIIDLLRAPFGLRAGYDFQTPSQSGVYTVEPYGAQFAFGAYERHVETFDLAIRGRGAAVMAALDNLQDFLEAIRLFHAGDLAAESCWLEWSAHGEEAKRTLLYSGTFKVSSSDNITPALEECAVIGTLSLTRHALWENVAQVAFQRTMSTLGGQDPLPTIPGNTLARMPRTYVQAAGAGIALYYFWIGVRRFNQGTDDFESLWECEDGTMISADTTVIADGGPIGDASPVGAGNHLVECDYTTSTALTSRMTITVSQVCAAAGHTSYAHQQGRYLVLCRCKVSAAGTSGIQLRYGYTGNMQAEEVYVDNTDWQLIPLGHISIPPWEGDAYGTDGICRYFRLDIYAEQLTAGHDLYLDCLVLIPNEHMLVTEGTKITAGSWALVANVTEDDQEVVYQVNEGTGEVDDSIDSEMTDWYLPQGDGVIVCAAQDQTDHDLAEDVTITINDIHRWLLYRGV